METIKVDQFNYRQQLNKELRSRQARNSRYSLRSFARDLGVSVTALSDVLNAKRGFSKKNALKIVDKLGWSPLQAKLLLEATRETKTQGVEVTERLRLQDDLFHVISEWYYLVILNLARIEDAKSSPKWVAKQLGISLREAEEALDRLKRLKYIQVSGGQLKRLIPEVETTTEIPSAAIRKYHRQNFSVAENAQEHIPFERRQISSFTVATDPRRMQKAKKMLVQFMDKIYSVLESPNPTEVYTLSTQLFPPQLRSDEDRVSAKTSPIERPEKKGCK